jgi:PII-like signaling protein
MDIELGQAMRLRIYLGEEKRDGDRPLYQAIIRQARRMHLAGATVIRGTQGYGRSTRLHTAEVLFSDDLPVIVEIIDHAENIDAMVALLDHRDDIALMTCEPVTLRGTQGLHDASGRSAAGDTES